MNHPLSRRAARARSFTVALCLAAAATATVGSVSARELRNPEARVRAPAEQEFRVPMRLDAYRGNWIRELVQLRVLEQNLKFADEPMTAFEQEQLFTPKIVGGTVAGSSDNPFQVALLTRSVANNFNAQFCGGTLHKANVVVTAAHCVEGLSASQIQVLTGTRRLDGSGVRRNVSSIRIHPSWNTRTFDYDVAVLRLTTSATGIPLASLTSSDGTVGTGLLVTGWGALSEGGSFPVDLRKVTVPLADRTNCNDSNSYNGQITTRMLCAGRDSGGIDSCQGDSGGPLTRGSALVGIVSWGQGCARANKFGVYARVSNTSIRNFIINNSL